MDRLDHGSRSMMGVAVLLSLAGHAGLLAILAGMEPLATEREPPVPLRVLERARPSKTTTPGPVPPEPLPSMKQGSPPPTERAVKRAPPLRKTAARPAPTPAAAPSPASPASSAPPSPRSFGIRLENVVQAAPGTGVVVPMGESLAAPPPAPPRPRLVSPGGTGDGTGDTTPVAAVQEMPKLMGDSMAEYPDEARRLGLQGKVVLEVVVDERGRVTHVRVLKSLHPLLDAAALRAARGLRFSPARVDGRPVTVKIPYTYVFVLE